MEDKQEIQREKELAGKYRKKNTARADQMNKMLFQNELKCGFEDFYVRAMFQGKYAKPSEFIMGEYASIFEGGIYPRFRNSLLSVVDKVSEYPYSCSWYRRSLRSENNLIYADKVNSIVEDFFKKSSIDADICDILEEKLG